MSNPSSNDTLVLKLGGQCLATTGKIIEAAQRISKLHKQGKKIVVVVSAMGNQTNELLNLSTTLCTNPVPRELDMLLSAGERISMSLMSLALNDLGTPAISFTGSQAGVMTRGQHSHAKIREIKPIRVDEELQKNNVVVIAGFQGVNPDTKEVTTLGRGGTDTTAVAFAAHYNAECIILKSVPGVFQADPNILSQAKRIEELSLDQFEEMAFWGAKIIHLNAVEIAKKLNKDFTIAHIDNWDHKTRILSKTQLSKDPKPLAISCHKELLKVSVPDSEKDRLGQFLSNESNYLPEHTVLMEQSESNEHTKLIKCHKQQQKGLISSLKNDFKNIQFTDDLCSIALTHSSSINDTTKGYFKTQLTQVTLCTEPDLQSKINECYNLSILGGKS